MSVNHSREMGPEQRINGTHWSIQDRSYMVDTHPKEEDFANVLHDLFMRHLRENFNFGLQCSLCTYGNRAACGNHSGNIFRLLYRGCNTIFKLGSTQSGRSEMANEPATLTNDILAD
jgi:hypothetical protein